MHCEDYHNEDTYYCKECRYENGETVYVKMPNGTGIGTVVNNPLYYRAELKYEIHGKVSGREFVTISSPRVMSRTAP